MSGLWPTLRRRILTPNVKATRLDVRGFHVKSVESRALLETVGATFLTGYGHAAEARMTEEAEERLELIPERFRGFAYEGAAMGFAVRDGIGRSDLLPRFAAGLGEAHLYMLQVGLGWAQARLPRPLWPHPASLDPLTRWLVHDGYGFHQAYFHTDRYVHRHERDRKHAADGPYADRAIDQGIGRALWFVGGTDPERVADLVDSFPAGRRADLYAGAGLAATYAGGADESELRAFAARAGELRSHLGQGSAFAAEARLRAGLDVPHTGLATKVFCGLTPQEAAAAAREARPADSDRHGPLPAYEVWRRRLTGRPEFAVLSEGEGHGRN